VLMYPQPCPEGKVLKISMSKVQQSTPAMAYELISVRLIKAFDIGMSRTALHKSQLMVHIAHGFNGTFNMYVCLYLSNNAEKISTALAQR